MRLFVGIKSSKNIMDGILKWQEKNKDLGVRFIKFENLHVTLIPPWYAEGPQNSLSKLRKLNSEFKPFEMTFDRIDVNFKNKVIWIESEVVPDEIIKLQKDLSNLFQDVHKENGRKFRPHITIARFKEGELLGDASFKKLNLSQRVSKITLFESKLGPKGANYKELN